MHHLSCCFFQVPFPSFFTSIFFFRFLPRIFLSRNSVVYDALLRRSAINSLLSTLLLLLFGRSIHFCVFAVLGSFRFFRFSFFFSPNPFPVIIILSFYCHVPHHHYHQNYVYWYNYHDYLYHNHHHHNHHGHNCNYYYDQHGNIYHNYHHNYYYHHDNLRNIHNLHRNN